MGHMGLNKKCISSQSSQHTFYQSQEYHLSKRTHAHTTHTRVTKRDSSSHRRTGDVRTLFKLCDTWACLAWTKQYTCHTKTLVWLVSRLSDLYLLSSMKCMRHLFVRRASVVQLARAICRLPLDTANHSRSVPANRSTLGHSQPSSGHSVFSTDATFSHDTHKSRVDFETDPAAPIVPSNGDSSVSGCT